jgi:hypothetical protein
MIAAATGVTATASVTAAAMEASTTGAHVVTVEVVEGFITALWDRTAVAMAGVVTVVDVTAEACAAVIPAPGTDEDPTVEPLRTVVAVG